MAYTKNHGRRKVLSLEFVSDITGILAGARDMDTDTAKELYQAYKFLDNALAKNYDSELTESAVATVHLSAKNCAATVAGEDKLDSALLYEAATVIKGYVDRKEAAFAAREAAAAS